MVFWRAAVGRWLAPSVGRHVMLALVLPGLQGEDESHNLPVEGPPCERGSDENLHGEIWEDFKGTPVPDQLS